MCPIDDLPPPKPVAKAPGTSINDLPPPPKKRIGDEFAASVPEPIKKAVGMLTSARAGLAKAGTLGYLDPEKTFAGDLTGGAVKEHPEANMVGQVAGTVAPAMAGGAAVAALKPANAITRIGANTGVSGLTGFLKAPEEGESRLDNAGTDAALGGGLGTAAEGVRGLMGAGKFIARKAANMTKGQANAYVNNTDEVKGMAKALEESAQMPKLQNQARDAIQKSRESLRSFGKGKTRELEQVLKGKSVSIKDKNLSQFEGLSPEIDKIISRAFVEGDTFKLSANDANSLKRALQDLAKYKPGTVMSPNQAARNEGAAAKAQGLRRLLEIKGGPKVKELNQAMQEATLTNEALKTGMRNNPLAFLAGESPDRVATLARAEGIGEGGMIDFGEKLGAAKTISGKDADDWLTRMGVRASGRAGLKATDAGQKAANPTSVQFLTQLFNLFSKENEKK